MSLLKINGVDLPAEPTVIQPGIQDLDSEDGTGRNQTGALFRDRVAVKRSVHVEFGIMSRTEMAETLSLMSPVSFLFTYPDPEDGALKTITAYVGDRVPAICNVISDNDWNWTGLSVDVVEM